MTDVLSPELRHKCMSKVKSKNTRPEMVVRKYLFSKGFRYRLHDRTLPGKPDIVLPKCNCVIFVNGCFWHGHTGCKYAKLPTTNSSFWESKISDNINRDKRVYLELEKLGWKIIVIWQCQLRPKMIETTLNQLINELTINVMERQNNRAFNLLDVGIKKAGAVQVYDERSLDETGAIIPFDTQMAIVTHYLLAKDTPFGEPFKNKALDLIDCWTDTPAIKKTLSTEVAAEASALQYSLFQDLFSVPFPAPQKPKFTFIDLFAGIGGFRMAMQNLGGKCVFSSEWDSQAQRTYFANYGEVPFGDITSEITKSYIPDNFDVLCAGFPCQAFSMAGKKLGFEETRGTLFFDVAEVIRRKRPKAFFLENVKGLQIHDKGRTLQTILKVLREDLNYYVPDPEIVNAMNFGVPQHRERIYIVGFRKDIHTEGFNYPEPTDTTKRWIDIREENPVSAKYYLSTQYIHTLIEHKKRHESKGNGFGYEIIPDDGIANAIVVGGMGRERNLVIDDRLTDFTPVTNIKGEVNRQGWRKMTPREWARLQGFPDDFQIVVADASAYKQFGNSVAVPAIQATAKELLTRAKLI